MRIYSKFKKRKKHWVNDCINWLSFRTLFFINRNVDVNFEKIIYINLDSRKDRRDNMVRQFTRLGLSAERQSACRIETLDEFRNRFPEHGRQQLSSFILKNPNGPLGYLGCFISHLKAIKNCKKNTGFSLICEDDLVILNRSWLKWIKDHLTIDFDVLFIDPQGDYYPGDRIKRNVYKISKQSPAYFGLHAYVIRNNRADKIIDLFYSCPLDSPDHCLLKACDQLDLYALRTSLSRPKGSFGTDMKRIDSP